jgi:ankyrin repeat protein
LRQTILQEEGKMMNKIIVLILFCLVGMVILSRCQRAPVPGFGFGFGPIKIVSTKEKDFYNAITVNRSIEVIESFLKDGHNPNVMNAVRAIPWYDNNPLWRNGNYEIAELLIKYGADVTERPYVWRITSDTPILSNRYKNDELLRNIRTRNEDDVCKLAKLFLEAGANPNLKGIGGLAPFSFTSLVNINKAYKEYFEEYGQLPIVVPIRFSAFDLVALLLEYGAILDELCLEAAKDATVRIGNDDMEKYIQTIWEKQSEVSRK